MLKVWHKSLEIHRYVLTFAPFDFKIQRKQRILCELTNTTFQDKEQQ